MSLQLTIVSPERTLFKGEVDSVFVPGTTGRFEVLENHAPIISSLTEGQLSYRFSELHSINIKSGFIEVAKNKVSICVEV
ncbi:MAG: hypothetical protein RR386_01245 [Bacteroidaceae bacterium]